MNTLRVEWDLARAPQATLTDCVGACAATALHRQYGLPLGATQRLLIQDLHLGRHGTTFERAIRAIRRRWPLVKAQVALAATPFKKLHEVASGHCVILGVDCSVLYGTPRSLHAVILSATEDYLASEGEDPISAAIHQRGMDYLRRIGAAKIGLLDPSPSAAEGMIEVHYATLKAAYEAAARGALIIMRPQQP